MQSTKYERIVRRLRQRIFDYCDAGKGDKASRILRKAIARKIACYSAPVRDETGHTAYERRMLARNGVCVTDF